MFARICCITSLSVGPVGMLVVAGVVVGVDVGIGVLVDTGVTRLGSGWAPGPSGLPRLAKGSLMGALEGM